MMVRRFRGAVERSPPKRAPPSGELSERGHGRHDANGMVRADMRKVTEINTFSYQNS